MFTVNNFMVATSCYDEAVVGDRYTKIFLPTSDNYILIILSSALTRINERESSDGYDVWELENNDDGTADTVTAYYQVRHAILDASVT